MKKIFWLTIFLTGFLLNSYSQLRSIKGHCGLYYRNFEDLLNRQEDQLKFYNFKQGQTIASIGAQCCNWEAAYAAVCDSINFYLEDIDSTYFNEKQARFAWNYYDSLRGKRMTSNYHLVLGDEKKTNLPDHYFDKILIINSFHEFGFQKEMLADIKKKLKPGGILYIDETLAKKSGELHHVCNKRIYLSEELIAILKENSFEYVDGLDMEFRKSKPVRKIFAFRKVKDQSPNSKLLSELIAEKELLTAEFWKQNISQVKVYEDLDTLLLLRRILYRSNERLTKIIEGADLSKQIFSQIDYQYFSDRLEETQIFFPPFYDSYFLDKIYNLSDDGRGYTSIFQRNSLGQVIIRTVYELLDSSSGLQFRFDEVSKQKIDTMPFDLDTAFTYLSFVVTTEKDTKGNNIIIYEDVKGKPKRKYKYYYDADGLLKAREFWIGNNLSGRLKYEYLME